MIDLCGIAEHVIGDYKYMMYVIIYFFFFFLIIRHPPRSTLFPYTPLSRSVTAAGAATASISTTLPGRRYVEVRRLIKIRRHHQQIANVIDLCGRLALDLIGRGDGDHTFVDRKSTRLNSRHLVISYAVFCLK